LNISTKRHQSRSL